MIPSPGSTPQGRWLGWSLRCNWNWWVHVVGEHVSLGSWCYRAHCTRSRDGAWLLGAGRQPPPVGQISETLYEAGAHRFWVCTKLVHIAFVQVNQTGMRTIGSLSFYPSLLLLISLTMNWLHLHLFTFVTTKLLKGSEIICRHFKFTISNAMICNLWFGMR